MFQRKHHNDILGVLRCLDGDLLQDAECYFGGGTAIVLKLGEYRESVDIYFLCASQEGYRKLRQALWGSSDLTGLLLPSAGIKTLRDVRTDQYGIRTLIGGTDVAIKFEIVREARIQLAGDMDDRFGVHVLTRDCLYAEKLLANADRWADKAVLSRDILDLSMMILRWGPIPDGAWDIAEGAYGDTARKAYDKAIARIRNPEWLRRCMAGMDMQPDLEGEVLALHGGPLDKES
ncbi:nucleotidyl transferase AbiEii/AbiGii toxin family protein [Pseudoroseicyclus aestuarii]|uniref:Nucleotidyltransferase AbiEii toxin of type IV toxin-antitoxin system n=1 Tax=Pseudoroseicyclus aestuarii TaxID=1795041 RepID=A0A318SSG8_9RHOB|nr:nucleotidyl transferase AbiEii/AbiGii toxin family protein [Pseudoroseicyclus aestuarii]PYE82212.1 nucleotidyltransferase AbiEii toxin of type IV toxin-antitoxin system [Pseudoroseicyclus aestuarii]